MNTILTICYVLNSVWLVLTGFIGMYVTAKWATNKIIQELLCKHNNMTIYTFRDSDGYVIREVNRCCRCKKIIEPK